MKFELRQYHAVTEDARVLFRDHRVGDEGGGEGLQQDSRVGGHTISTRTRKTVVHRPRRRSSKSPLEEDSSDDYGFGRWRGSGLGSRPPPSSSSAHSPPSASPSSTSSSDAELDWGWDEDEVEAPDVDDRETLLALAKMTNNAYLEYNETGWYDLGGEWNVVSPNSRLENSVLNNG